MPQIHRQGWLRKFGARGFGKRRLRRRWFILEDLHLRYYEKEPNKVKIELFSTNSDQGGELLGTINLIGIQRVVADPETDPFCFKIEVSGRVYAIIAENEVDMNEWMRKIDTQRDMGADIHAIHTHETGHSALTTVKEGWLIKSKHGAFKKSQKRYCVLTQLRLAYYEAPTDEEPIHTIPVDDLNLLREEQPRKYPDSLKHLTNI